jgi:hypothetical protein
LQKNHSDHAKYNTTMAPKKRGSGALKNQKPKAPKRGTANSKSCLAERPVYNLRQMSAATHSNELAKNKYFNVAGIAASQGTNQP